MVKAKRGMAESSHMPRMHEMNSEYERLMEENKRLQEVKPKQNQGMLNEQ
jgi:hypothetical protein